LGSLGSDLSSVERGTDLLMAVSPGKESLFDLSMAMTDTITSFDSDTLRSLSLAIDLRTEPKPPKELRDGLGETEIETGVTFLLGPNDRRERSERKEGIPELAGGIDGE